MVKPYLGTLGLLIAFSCLDIPFGACSDLAEENPGSEQLYWQIDEGGEFDRIHWLTVNGTQGGDSDSAVVANKAGNAVHLSASNVAAVTLLISSDHFDLDKNIQVWLNQVLVFDERVSPDVGVLEKWFELDQDRSMLFASEIYLDV